MAQLLAKKSKSKTRAKTSPRAKLKKKMPQRKKAAAKKSKKASAIDAAASRKTKANQKKISKTANTALRTGAAPLRARTTPRAAVRQSPSDFQSKNTPASATPSAYRVTDGDPAPEFSLPDQNQNQVSLADFRGKNVVLYFYPKDDTPGCTSEACSFRDHYSELQEAGAALLGVSFDDAASHQKFIGKYNLNFPLLTDADKDVAKAYGVSVQKNMYGNISWGIERSTFVIDREGQIVKAFRRVSVDGHTQDILEILRSLN